MTFINGKIILYNFGFEFGRCFLICDGGDHFTHYYTHSEHLFSLLTILRSADKRKKPTAMAVGFFALEGKRVGWD
jgi:hypothetical protein